jgi:protein phosphatase 2C
MDCMPLWGYTSICGHSASIFDMPMWMITGNAVVDGLDP